MKRSHYCIFYLPFTTYDNALSDSIAVRQIADMASKTFTALARCTWYYRDAVHPRSLRFDDRLRGLSLKRREKSHARSPLRLFRHIEGLSCHCPTLPRVANTVRALWWSIRTLYTLL